MTDNGEIHVIFGTGPVGMSVMDELSSRGKRVRMVNRSGRADVPEGVEVRRGRRRRPRIHPGGELGCFGRLLCSQPALR